MSKRLTSNFGYRTDPFKGSAAFHAGIDIAGKIGDPVYAAGAGKVITTDKDSSHGKYIVVEHPGGLQTWYLHLSSIDISTGDTVTKGESIGKLGNTGRSTGPHLHFEIVKQGKQINPLPYLEQNN
ncbi:Murein DD-endopeptidase MepM [compost metagenome]